MAGGPVGERSSGPAQIAPTPPAASTVPAPPVEANGSGPATPGGQAPAILTMKTGYALLSAASGFFSLFMGALGETGYFVLFGIISLSFLRRLAGLRKVRASRASDGNGLRDYRRGGFPLVVIAVASILLALSAISFVMNAAAVNDPDDGTCDYDRSPATVVYRAAGDDGAVTQRRELCDAHAGYFLAASPLHSRDLVTAAGGVATYRGQPIPSWAPALSALWAVFVSFMIAASVTLPSPATRWESPFVICGLGRGILAMTTGLAATLLFVLVSVSLAGVLDGAGPDRLLYGAMMVVFAASLATFFRRRGGAG